MAKKANTNNIKLGFERFLKRLYGNEMSLVELNEVNLQLDRLLDELTNELNNIAQTDPAEAEKLATTISEMTGITFEQSSKIDHLYCVKNDGKSVGGVMVSRTQQQQKDLFVNEEHISKDSVLKVIESSFKGTSLPDNLTDIISNSVQTLKDNLKVKEQKTFVVSLKKALMSTALIALLIASLFQLKFGNHHPITSSDLPQDDPTSETADLLDDEKAPIEKKTDLPESTREEETTSESEKEEITPPSLADETTNALQKAKEVAKSLTQAGINLRLAQSEAFDEFNDVNGIRGGLTLDQENAIDQMGKKCSDQAIHYSTAVDQLLQQYSNGEITEEEYSIKAITLSCEIYGVAAGISADTYIKACEAIDYSKTHMSMLESQGISDSYHDITALQQIGTSAKNDMDTFKTMSDALLIMAMNLQKDPSLINRSYDSRYLEAINIVLAQQQQAQNVNQTSTPTEAAETSEDLEMGG